MIRNEAFSSAFLGSLPLIPKGAPIFEKNTKKSLPFTDTKQTAFSITDEDQVCREQYKCIVALFTTHLYTYILEWSEVLYVLKII